MKREERIQMTMAQRLVAALASYTGDNEWEDVIRDTERGWILDGEATEEADPQGMSDIAVLADGSVVVWDEVSRCWRVGS